MNNPRHFVIPLLAAALAASLDAQSPRPQVMIVGSYHMANPSQDFANITADDVLAPKRQSEIARLVELLAAYRPTVIALEYTPNRDSLMNTRYSAFRAGTYIPSRDESEQVGFRLAAKLGLGRVAGIDYPEDLDVNGMMNFAMANGFRQFGMDVQSDLQRMIATTNKQMATLTVPEIFAENNGPMMDPLFAFYLRAAQVGKDTNYVGAHMAATWYDRNLHILSNISRLITKPDDRVLVLIGSGHAAILRSLIAGAGDWQSVDPVPFLRK